MKKLTLLFVALLASGVMFGQFTIGPQIGYTATKLTSNTSELKASFKSNFLFGAFARIGDKVYVQPEINWLTQGGIWEDNTSAVSDPTKIEMNYKTIQIPVSVGYRLINLKVANIRVFAGLAANIATDKKMKIDGITQDLKDADWKDMVWQYQAGVGVDVLMLALNVKYMGGLNDIYNGSDIEFDGKSFSTKSNLFMVTLGWKIL